MKHTLELDFIVKCKKFAIRNKITLLKELIKMYGVHILHLFKLDRFIVVNIFPSVLWKDQEYLRKFYDIYRCGMYYKTLRIRNLLKIAIFHIKQGILNVSCFH
jgi:hypothetical protein